MHICSRSFGFFVIATDPASWCRDPAKPGHFVMKSPVFEKMEDALHFVNGQAKQLDLNRWVRNPRVGE